jgi:hypothetical protein
MSYDNKAQGSAMLDRLTKVGSMYTNQYLSVSSSQGIYTAQKKKLEATLNSLEKQIDAKNDTIRTYDQELKDRNAVSRPYTFWRLRGLSTLQDWVLFSFFVVYGLVTLFLAGLSLRSEFPLYSISIVLLSSFSLAVVIMASIVRFA